MGDEEQLTINGLGRKLDRFTGFALATCSIGGVLLLVVGLIFKYSFDKLESHNAMIAKNSTHIAVTSSKLIDYDRWRESIDIKLERVKYHQ